MADAGKKPVGITGEAFDEERQKGKGERHWVFSEKNAARGDGARFSFSLRVTLKVQDGSRRFRGLRIDIGATG